jgi:hypothetical protein
VQAAPEVTEYGVVAARKIGKGADDFGHAGGPLTAEFAGKRLS